MEYQCAEVRRGRGGGDGRRLLHCRLYSTTTRTAASFTAQFHQLLLRNPNLVPALRSYPAQAQRQDMRPPASPAAPPSLQQAPPSSLQAWDASQQQLDASSMEADPNDPIFQSDEFRVWLLKVRGRRVRGGRRLGGRRRRGGRQQRLVGGGATARCRGAVRPPTTPKFFQLPSSPNYCLQVLPCSKRFVHDWTSCPFSHAGEKAVRRDPRTHTYTGIACPDHKRVRLRQQQGG